MSYHGAPGTNADGVRVLVGDISTSTGYEFLGDADYSFFLLQSSNNLFLAAQLACQSLSALFASSYMEKKVGDLLLRRYPDMAAQYRKLGADYASQALATISPSAGGISRSDKRNAEMNSDRVQPFFKRRLFDSYLSLSPSNTVPGSSYTTITSP